MTTAHRCQWCHQLIADPVWWDDLPECPDRHDCARRMTAAPADLMGVNPATEQQPTDPPVHVGGGANAENCPACKASPTLRPYPRVCPGPATEDTEEDDNV